MREAIREYRSFRIPWISFRSREFDRGKNPTLKGESQIMSLRLRGERDGRTANEARIDKISAHSFSMSCEREN